MNLGVLHSLIRLDEKMVFSELEKKRIPFQKIDERKIFVDIERNSFGFDLVIDRSMNYFTSLMALNVLNSFGIKSINSFDVVQTCGNKLLTSTALVKAGIEIPRTLIANSPESAIQAIEELGFPCVVKPLIGSWGRMVSKVNDMDSAESLIEHKKVLGNFLHSVFYVQEFIEKNGRDIRSFVVGDEVVAAIYRESSHWITNTARGGKALNCEVGSELGEVSLKAARACGGGVLAVDLIESERGLLVNEVNHSMEFKNSVSVTGVNIPEKIVEFAVKEART